MLKSQRLLKLPFPGGLKLHRIGIITLLADDNFESFSQLNFRLVTGSHGLDILSMQQASASLKVT